MQKFVRWYFKATLPVATFFVAVTAAPAATFGLSTATIANINAAMDAGALSSEKLLALYLNRIEAFDKSGPKVNSVVALNPKALDEARAPSAPSHTETFPPDTTYDGMFKLEC